MNHGGQVWQGGNPLAWLDFSANIRPDGPPDWVLEAIHRAIGEVGYYPDPEMVAERRGLCAFLNLPEACVLPTAGGIEAIDLAMHGVKGGAKVDAPTFSEYAPALARLDLKAEGEAVVLCNPNNPTGAALSRDEVLGMLPECPLLIVDEAFIYCCPERSVAGAVTEYKNLIVVGSLTKSLGIPGVRLGYLCAHPRTMDRLQRFQRPWALNCFGAAVLRALPRDALSDDVKINRMRRAELSAGLVRLGAKVYPSEASFVLARFDMPVRPIAEALKARGILVRECMNFPGIDDGYHLRLAVKAEAQNAILLSELEAVL